MARQRKLSDKRKALIKGILAEYQPTTAGEAQLILTANYERLQNQNPYSLQMIPCLNPYIWQCQRFALQSGQRPVPHSGTARDITAKWQGRPRDWSRILEQLMIYFEGRLTLADID